MPSLVISYANRLRRFLLALLQTQAILEAISKSEVRRSLKKLTHDLGQAFENTLARIDSQPAGRRNCARKALSLVSRAFRPLEIDELRYLLATTIGEDIQFDEDALISSNHILGSCLGLMRFDESSRQVRLIHLALRDYLQGKELEIKKGWDTQAYFTGALLTYLTFLDQSSGSKSPYKLDSLRHYGLMSWGHHAMAVSTASKHLVEAMILTYLKQSEKHYERIRIRRLPQTAPNASNSTLSQSVLKVYPYNASGLHVVAAFGLADLTDCLIKDHSADVDAVDGNGNTPLHLATANQHLTATVVLLQRKAKMTIKNDQQCTPLYEAVATGNMDILQQLLDHGAPVNVACEDQWSPLHRAAADGDVAIVELLIQRTASVTAESYRGLTPLHRAAGRGHISILKILISAGTPIDCQTFDGWSPLHGACNSGHLEAARLLLLSDAHVNLQDVDGRTPLHRAARNGHLSTIQFLLENGADRLAQDFRGCNALHRVAKGGHIAAIEMLLGNTAAIAHKQLSTLNDEEMTPREHAAHQGQWYIAQVLRLKEEECGLSFPLTVSAVETAITAGDLPTLKELFHTGADLPRTTSEGFSLFQLSLGQEQEDISLFLSSQPGMDIAASTSEGWQALHCAANTGNSNLVRLCLDLKADISARTNIGETALNKACRSGNLECVQLLIDAGAQVNVADSWGWTPLHKAALSGSLPIVELLLDHGAFIGARTKKQATAQICANDAGHWAVSDFLRQSRYNSRKSHSECLEPPFSENEADDWSDSGDKKDLDALSKPDQRLKSIRCDARATS